MADGQPVEELIPHFLRQLDESRLGVAEYASRDLERIGAPAVAPLIALLEDKSANAHARGWAARTLGHIGDKRAYEAMVSALIVRGEDPGVRRMAAFYLGRLGDRRATSPLIEIMMNRAEPVDLRKNATRALGELGGTGAFEALLEMLGDEEVQTVAAHALEELRDPRAAPALLPLFNSNDERLRRSAAVIVGKRGTQALDELLAAVESADWRVRWSATTALGFTNSERAVTPLTAALQNDPNATVRAQAAAALDFGADGHVVHALTHALVHDEDVRVRQACVHSLLHLTVRGQIGGEVLSALEIAAHDTGTIGGHPVVSRIAQMTIDTMKRSQSEPGARDQR